MSVGLNMIKYPLLFSFVPFLNSFFEFGRQIFNFFPESFKFHVLYNQLTSGIYFLFKRFYGFCESLIESFLPWVSLIINDIPQQFTWMRNQIGKYQES